MCDISTTRPPIQATKKDPEMILFPENSVMKKLAPIIPKQYLEAQNMC
jgi:hypothetical protein